MHSLKVALALAIALLVPTTTWAEAPATRGVNAEYPLQTKNRTVVTMYHEYQILIEEVTESVSQGNAGLLTHDAARWRAAITSMSAYLDFAQSRAIPDYAATHGRPMDLLNPLFPECLFKSNPYVCEFLQDLMDARDELVVSSSNGVPRSLYPADETRQREYWEGMSNLIAYMEAYSPMDQPITAAEEQTGTAPPLTPTP